MPSIPPLDNITSYAAASFLYAFIKTGPTIFSVLAAAGLVFDITVLFKKIHNIVLRIFFILLEVLTVLLLVFCILYDHDGRYSHQDIDLNSNNHRYYFGKVNNGHPDGFGKEFESDKTIYYIGNFAAGKAEGHGKRFSKSGDIIYINYEGEYVDNQPSGKGTSYVFVNGQHRVFYEGDYKLSEFDGNGKLTNWNDDGTINSIYSGGFKKGKYNGWGKLAEYSNMKKTYFYEGGWYNGKRTGYATELDFVDEKITSAYQGLYWYDVKTGTAIWEYYSQSNDLTVWYGIITDGKMTEDGAYYHAGGGFFPSKDNGSLAENEETGNVETVQEVADSLMERWPYPEGETLIKP